MISVLPRNPSPNKKAGTSSSGGEGKGVPEPLTININAEDVKNKNKSGLSGSALIGRFHALYKWIAAARKNPSLLEEERGASIAKWEEEIEGMGGIDAYHKASFDGESNNEYGAFNASKWVLSEIPSHLKKGRGIKLLDVGALVNHYVPVKWIDSVAINLNPTHESVSKCDIIDYKCDKEDDMFDVVVLSLVVNFEGDPRRRGEILRAARNLLRPGGGGLLYFVLPRACLDNSRYMKHSMLVKMFKSLGTKVVSQSTSNKLSLYTFKVDEEVMADLMNYKSFPRTLCRGGTTRNNFCIVLENKGGAVYTNEEEEEGEGEGDDAPPAIKGDHDGDGPAKGEQKSLLLKKRRGSDVGDLKRSTSKKTRR